MTKESVCFADYAERELHIWDTMAKHRERERSVLFIAGLAVVLMLMLFVAALTFDYNNPKRYTAPENDSFHSFPVGSVGGWGDASLSGTIMFGPMFLKPGIRGPWETIFGWIGSSILGHYFEPIVDCATGPDPCVPPNGVGGGGGGGIQPDPVPGGGGGWARKANPWLFALFDKKD